MQTPSGTSAGSLSPFPLPHHHPLSFPSLPPLPPPPGSSAAAAATRGPPHHSLSQPALQPPPPHLLSPLPPRHSQQQPFPPYHHPLAPPQAGHWGIQPVDEYNPDFLLYSEALRAQHVAITPGSDQAVALALAGAPRGDRARDLRLSVTGTEGAGLGGGWGGAAAEAAGYLVQQPQGGGGGGGGGGAVGAQESLPAAGGAGQGGGAALALQLGLLGGGRPDSPAAAEGRLKKYRWVSWRSSWWGWALRKVQLGGRALVP